MGQRMQSDTSILEWIVVCLCDCVCVTECGCVLCTGIHTPVCRCSLPNVDLQKTEFDVSFLLQLFFQLMFFFFILCRSYLFLTFYSFIVCVYLCVYVQMLQSTYKGLFEGNLQELVLFFYLLALYQQTSQLGNLSSCLLYCFDWISHRRFWSLPKSAIMAYQEALEIPCLCLSSALPLVIQGNTTNLFFLH